MNIPMQLLPCGALVLTGDHGSLLIGGGHPVEALIEETVNLTPAVSGILLPCEHVHRARGTYELARRNNIPLIGHLMPVFRTCVASTGPLPPFVVTIWHSEGKEFGEFFIESFPMDYDSLTPCGWIVTLKGVRYGILPDGRPNEKSLSALRSCDVLVLMNILKTMDHPAVTMAEKRKEKLYPSGRWMVNFLKQGGVNAPVVVAANGKLWDIDRIFAQKRGLIEIDLPDFTTVYTDTEVMRSAGMEKLYEAVIVNVANGWSGDKFDRFAHFCIRNVLHHLMREMDPRASRGDYVVPKDFWDYIHANASAKF